MNISDENSKNRKSSYPPGLRDISLDKEFKELPHVPSRIELHKEDPFSLKVIEGLEKQGLFIRWRFGYRLANRYEVRRIHSGGMGIVWIVEDLFDNRKPYAAKSVKPFFRKPETDEEWARRENAIQRFLEECKIWVDLEKHRHIVHAEFLEKIEGVPLVMSEYIEGGDLAAQIEKGPLPLETVLDYAIQFCIGMEYANNKGVLVHRDIKPGNIMIIPEGVLKVGDFGLTKAIMASEEIRKEEQTYEESQSPIEAAIISVSRGFGTPPYMAPEQFSERLLKHVKHPIYPVSTACDIFAFGLVLYEMLKGKHAYYTELGADRETWDNAHRIASSVSFHPAYVYYFLKSINLNLSKPISDNEQLDNLILKCLKKNPEERFKSFTELKEKLLRIFPTLEKVGDSTLRGGKGGFTYKMIKEPPFKPNYKNKGKTAFILGREDEAIKSYDKALEENPADTDTWLEKGLALAEMGKLGEFGVCMEVIPYLKPSKRNITEHHTNRVLKDLDLGKRDLRLLEDIASKYPIQEVRDQLSYDIENQNRFRRRYDMMFNDSNPELMWLMDSLQRDPCAAWWMMDRVSDSSLIYPFLVESLKKAAGNSSDSIPYGRHSLNTIIPFPPFLITALKDEDVVIRTFAVKAFTERIRYLRYEEKRDYAIEYLKGVSLLIYMLQDEAVTPDVRKIMIDLLREIQEPAAIPELIAAIFNDDVSVRRAAAYALAENKDSSGLGILIEACKDEDKYVRLAAARALGQLGNFSAMSILIEALNEEDVDCRVTAASSLGKIKNNSAIPALTEVLKNDVDDTVRTFAARALGELNALSVLIEALNNRDSFTRKASVYALGLLKNPSTIPFLKEILINDIDADVRKNAVWALGRMKAVSVLSEALQIEDAVIRKILVEELGELEEPSAIPILRRIVDTHGQARGTFHRTSFA